MQCLVYQYSNHVFLKKFIIYTRTYSSFTMETILATAFGRVINIQKGESDSLAEAAAGLFETTHESSKTSADHVAMITSESNI